MTNLGRPIIEVKKLKIYLLIFVYVFLNFEFVLAIRKNML